jgi:2-(3-amino-3-carboxypropyl)histidine synthase
MTTTTDARRCADEGCHKVVADPQRKRQRVEQGSAFGVPPEISENPELLRDMAARLPPAYNFEVPKTVWILRKHQVRRVALQFPEGLLLFAIALKDILERHVSTLGECIVMSDVAFGACCVDDLQAKALGCDYLVHYGHSCLVPLTQTCLRTLYVFVEIAIDVDPLVDLIRRNFANTPLALVGTIQFNGALHTAKRLCPELDLLIPQSRPLSAGEILGCTAPRLVNDAGHSDDNAANRKHPRAVIDMTKYETVLYVGDGRFHLEAMMMANPDRTFLKYDPYTQVCSRETLDFGALRQSRLESMERAKNASQWGVLVGAIGRQGNPAIADGIVRVLRQRDIPHVVVVMDEEITNERLGRYADVEAWVQVACPRLSLDWGYAFSRPLLTPFEFYALFDPKVHMPPDHFPMDYYANGPEGPWANYHPSTADRHFSVDNFK